MKPEFGLRTSRYLQNDQFSPYKYIQGRPTRWMKVLQKRAVRLIEHVYPPHSSEPIFKKCSILKLTDLAKSQILLVMHTFETNQLPLVFDKIYQLNADNSPHRHNGGIYQTTFLKSQLSFVFNQLSWTQIVEWHHCSSVLLRTGHPCSEVHNEEDNA